MKKTFSAFIAIVLSLGIVGSTLSVGAAEVSKDSSGSSSAVSQAIDDVSLEATNSFGGLLTESIDEELDKQQKNNGFNIFSVYVPIIGSKVGNEKEKIFKKSVQVEFEAKKDCTLVVGIYTEDSKKFLASGSKNVVKGDKKANVTIAIDEMPSYFYLKAYLIDSTTFRPLCSAYESPNYTKDMQKLINSTTKDYDTNKVLNLDGDETNNFAVYNDKTKIIKKDGNKNKVVLKDDKNKKYVLENVNDEIASLKSGDVFSYNYNKNNDVLIVRVSNIQIDGTTATITGSDAELEDVFDYVKIDGSSSVSEYNSNGRDESLTEKVPESELEQKKISRYGISTMAIETGGETSAEKSFGIEKEFKNASGELSGSISGTLTAEMGASITLYISFSKQYLEVKLDYSLGVNAKIKGKYNTTISLGQFKFVIVAGVLVSIDPSVVVEAKIETSIKGALEGTVGFRVTGGGIKNITSTPKFNTEVNAEGTLYIGFSLEPKLEIVSEKVASVSIDAQVGMRLSAEVSQPENTSTVKHNCMACLEGNFKAEVTLSFGAKLIGLGEVNLKITGLSIDLFDFYFNSKGFGLGGCPNRQYKVTVKTKNASDSPMSGVDIKIGSKDYGKTEKGEKSLFLNKGEYTLKLSKKGYETEKYNLEVENDGGQRVLVTLFEDGTATEDDEKEDKPDVDEEILEPIKDVANGYDYTMALTESGDLYTWGGKNKDGQLGDNRTGDECYEKRKILSNVKSIAIDEFWGCSNVAVTNDGKLFVWGYNGYSLGVGTMENVFEPTQILENEKVAMADIDTSNGAAVTEDGKLYVWGANGYGQLGDGTTENSLTPKRIMSDVSIDSVYVTDYCIGAIDKNGNLYMCGYNGYGRLGIGSEIPYITTPKLILTDVRCLKYDDIKQESFGAITKDGDLYMWGHNDCGQVGDGTTNDVSRPKKIMSNVASISLGMTSTGAVTKNGDLYTWGSNGSNNGEGYNTTPEKIMSNVLEIVYGQNSAIGIIKKGGSLYYCYLKYDRWEMKYHWEMKYIANKVVSTKVGAPSREVQSFITDKGELYIGNLECFELQKIKKSDSSTSKSSLLKTSLMAKGLSMLSTSTAKRNILATYAADENTDETTEIIDTRKKEFTSLNPNTVYNFYLMKSKTAKNPLGSSNLLYITQAVSDNDGKLTIKYDTAKEYESADYFIEALRIDISNATVKVGKSYTATNKVQYVKPTVKLNGKKLKEGIDYELRGDFKFINGGLHTIWVKGIGTYTGKAKCQYTVKCNYSDTPLVNKSTINATNVTKGTLLKLTGKATGGAEPYKYKYYYKPAYEKNYKEPEETTTASLYIHMTEKEGVYNYAIKVEDANGKTNVKYFVVTVNQPLVNKSTINAKVITKGSSIKMTARAENGTAPYKYKYFYKLTESSGYTPLTSTTKETTYTHTPEKSGTYSYAVKIADSCGKTATKYFTVKVNPPIKNESSISTTKITLGSSIKLTANASGGTAPYKYKYFCNPAGSSEYSALTDTTTNTTCTHKPEREGTYKYAVKIADSTGRTSTKYFVLKVNPKLKNTSTISATTIKKGASIKLTANADGGTAPYKYKYYCKPKGASKYTALTNTTTKTTYTHKPARAITYNYAVKIADATGKTSTKYFILTVK